MSDAKPPQYVTRIARLPEVFDVLAAHPDGIRLTSLAEQIKADPDELREDLLAYYTADISPIMFGLSRPAVLEFCTVEGDEDDPATAEVVRIGEDGPVEELGVEYVDPADLALIHSAAVALFEMEPDDDLRGAIEVLTETVLGTAGPSSDPTVEGTLGLFVEAIADSRRVRIVYSRAWEEGVVERTIDPYLLVRTRRGWEVDAGPVDEKGRIRTYLVSNLRTAEVTTETFTEPDDLADLLTEQRRTSRVRVRVPYGARWAADHYAERVTQVDEDGSTVTLDLDLLPPLPERVGRLLLASGPDASIIDPSGLVAHGPRLAAELLAHYRR